MNELQVFSYEGNEVRTVQKGNETWWVLKDVCDILEIANSRDVADRLDPDEKNTVVLNDGIPGNPNKTIISDFKSRKYKLGHLFDCQLVKSLQIWIGCFSSPGSGNKTRGALPAPWLIRAGHDS